MRIRENRGRKKKPKQGKGFGKCRVTGKSQYADPETAKQAITFLFSRDPSLRPGDLHVYRCPDCGFLHVGHWKYFKGDGQ